MNVYTQPSGVLSDGTTIDALTMLQRVADRDIGDELLDWLRKREPAGDVLAVALRTLTSCTGSGHDLADRIIAKPEYLRYFSGPSMRRPSGQTPLRMLMGQPVPSELFANTPFSASELFFRDLLRADPLRNAKRLLDRRADADVSRPLAALADVAFTRDDDAFVRFALRRLADSDATQGILTSTLRAIPDFQRRMRPHFEQMLEQLAPVESAEAIARFRTSMDAAVPPPSTVVPEPSVLGTLWKTLPLNPAANPLGYAGIARAPTTSPRQELPSIRFRRAKSAVSLLQPAAATTLLALAAFAFNGDIPAGASLGTRLLSRGLSLLAAIIVCAAIAYVYAGSTRALMEKTTGYNLRVTSTADTLRQSVPLFSTFAAYAVFDAHSRYVGPLHFWNQSLVFFLNSLGIVLLARSFELE